MLNYLLRRILSLLITLVISSVVIFVSLEIIPGDPASYMLGINAQPDTIEALREELGLNRNKFERYLVYLELE